MSAFTGVFDVKRMKEEGNGVVVWGRENNSAVHAIVVIVWPARTLQIAKCLFIFSVAICNLIGKNHSRGAVKHLGFESDDCSIHGRIKRCS